MSISGVLQKEMVCVLLVCVAMKRTVPLAITPVPSTTTNTTMHASSLTHLSTKLTLASLSCAVRSFSGGSTRNKSHAFKSGTGLKITQKYCMKRRRRNFKQKYSVSLKVELTNWPQALLENLSRHLSSRRRRQTPLAEAKTSFSLFNFGHLLLKM